MALVQDPKVLELMSQSPMAQAAEAAMAAHISEHIAFQYRREIEKQLGVPLPPPDEPLADDIEYRLSQLVAPAAEQLLGKDKKEAEMQKREEELEDPIIQMQRQELEIKQQQVQSKAQAEMAKINLDMQKAASKDQLERDRLDLQERTDRAKLGAKIASENSRDELENRKIASKTEIEGVKIGVDIAKDLMGE
jgi:multidrug efflux pump subunit AcrA (membrane-fusion protein)